MNLYGEILAKALEGHAVHVTIEGADVQKIVESACYQALEQIQKALEASDRESPGDPAMFEHYGDIAAARGDRESALRGWSKALDLFQRMDYPEDAARVRLKLEKQS